MIFEISSTLVIVCATWVLGRMCERLSDGDALYLAHSLAVSTVMCLITYRLRAERYVALHFITVYWWLLYVLMFATPADILSEHQRKVSSVVVCLNAAISTVNNTKRSLWFGKYLDVESKVYERTMLIHNAFSVVFLWYVYPLMFGPVWGNSYVWFVRLLLVLLLTVLMYLSMDDTSITEACFVKELVTCSYPLFVYQPYIAVCGVHVAYYCVLLASIFAFSQCKNREIPH